MTIAPAALMEPRMAVIARAIEAYVFFMEVVEQGIAANERQDARLFCTGPAGSASGILRTGSCGVNERILRLSNAARAIPFG
jgi:hypothetical protein